MITGTIVLEGGATRGVFTSGILDYLMEEDLYFSHVIGVSAGSCNGVDYVSRQIGRTKKCMIPEKKEYSYYSGVRSAIKEKSILDMDMVFDTFPKKIYPFDFETYFQSDMVCEIVTTNCETGKAEYMTEQSDPGPAYEAVQGIQQYAFAVAYRQYRRCPISGWGTCRFGPDPKSIAIRE